MSTPIILSVVPNIVSTAGGELVIITGNNFEEKDKIIIGGRVQKIESIKPSEIKFRTYPNTTGTFQIVIERVDSVGDKTTTTFDNAIIFNNNIAPTNFFNLTNIIGKGISYPVKFSNSFKKNELLSLSSDREVIRQSIQVILATRPGQRLYNLQFGCRISELIFEQNDDLLKDLLYIYTLESLRRWEPRIRVTSLGFLYREDDPHYIGIRINYVILQTNTPDSFVYPFVKGGAPSSSLHV